MRGLMPNPLTKLSESTEEDEVLRSRKRKLDIEAESDGEQLREQLRLRLEDKRILNGDAGKRLRRDFGRLLKSGEEGVPMADIDYEIYKYINELADQYIELDDLLEQNGVSYSEALEQAAQFRKQFLCLLEKHAVRNQDLVVICWDLMERIEQQPEHPDLQYLYFCVVTDFGLLNAVNAADRTEEQKIRNYFRQQNALRELTDFFQAQSENLQKYHALLEYLKKPRRVESGVRNEEDFDLLYHLTVQHAFLYGCKTNPVYEENLRALQLHINNDVKLKAVKPYIIFAVLARKTGMMQKRKYFMPNLKSIFQYQNYNIYKDNGKNFNQYASELELYDHLRRSYIDDCEIDMGLCDFCFANLSPLSEWYYQNCEPNEEIPMALCRKILNVMPKSFPYMLSYADYDQMNEGEVQLYSDAAKELLENMLHTAEKFLRL